ncbi:hypothetical protein LXM94_22850 [Rhizobium sp. TRM95111]|uniref:hypothetical protein n=1 Tax=Rhizobium alarense TaxID=2846851 RepID=UPI001F345B34|nr:hypothetical protein [Rhizobium alarense]MCF3642810.1 hypothetical protein [Rhizobium alarense]
MNRHLDERGDPEGLTHDPARKAYSAREARQGFPGLPVLKVLGASLLLAFVVWGGVELWGEGADTDGSTDATRTSSTASDTAAPGDQPTVDGTQQNAPVDEDPTAQSGTGGESQQVTPDGTQN